MYAISRLNKYNHSHLLPVEHNAFHKPLIIDDSSQNINLEPYDRKSEERNKIINGKFIIKSKEEPQSIVILDKNQLMN